MNQKTEISKAFNLHAVEYERHAKIQLEIGNRLFERLTLMKIEPRFILDLGCGTGIFSERLKRLYPRATIVSLDIAYNMLQCAKTKQKVWRKWPLVNADMLALPFASGSFDLVFANQVIHWSSSLVSVMRELNRILGSGGCLLFSTLGPDTFKELRSLEHAHAHTNDFLDMHDIGDSLMSECFLDPVVDMHRLTAQYSNVSALLSGLKAQGVRNINPLRNHGLTGKNVWQRFISSIMVWQTNEGKLPLTYEVVYGHAWKGTQTQKANGVEAIISLAELKASLKKSHG